ncbi:hypothetical protein PM082_002455 [Marasmius tenuissimus]|nr:hypothetical protein PM082_002455 [Marasmius tenuissimus]
MVEKAASRPWTKAEDELLRAAVGIHGAHDNWKAVATQVPGRNNKSCRKRWLHSLSPTIKKTPWTLDEDNRLLELMAVHGQKWSLIARQIPGRTDDACSKRYNEALDPSLRKGEWTAEEDEQLLKTLQEIGQYSWKEIGQCLQRSGLDCRNRYKLLERKRKSAETRPVESSKESSQEAVAQTMDPPPQLGFNPPYYPPESYPLYQEGTSFSYREPTPDTQLTPLFTQVHPFQLSPSSLSAALTDPSLSSTSNLLHPTSLHPSSCNTPSAQPSPTLSPSGHASGGDLIDEPNLLGNFPVSTEYLFHSQSMSSIYSEAIIAVDPPIPIQGSILDSPYPNPTLDFSKSPLPVHFDDLPSFYDRHAGSPFTNTSPETNVGEVSASCSPFEHEAQLPPTSLPDVIPEEGLRHHPSPPESLLFSGASTSRAPTPSEPMLAKKPSEPPTPRPNQRLSTDMPLSSESTAHFQQALSTTFCAIGNDESQQSHPDSSAEQEGDEQGKRYVCDQPDCFKTYKNASGLRYHKKHGHPKKLPMQLDDMPPSLTRDLPSRIRKMRKKDG